MTQAIDLALTEPVSEWSLLSARWVNKGVRSGKEIEIGKFYGFVSNSERYQHVLIEVLGASGERHYPHATTVELFDISDIRDVNGLADLVLRRAKDYSFRDKTREIYDDAYNLGKVSIYPFEISTGNYRTVANLPKFQTDAFQQLEIIVQMGKR